MIPFVHPPSLDFAHHNFQSLDSRGRPMFELQIVGYE
jgi:hypothetical protein